MADKTAGQVIRDQVESASRAIAKNIHGRGEMPLAQIQQETNCENRIFDWAIGWLVQEDEVEITAAGASFSIRRKEPDTGAPVFI